jgi:SAM-dependent methyltransferase
MADRRHGYDVSVTYTNYFFRELAPDWLDFCIHANGFEAQRTGPSYRYLDLGCGPGFHLCVLAAANPQAEFVGIDFQPEHIAHGQELAASGGLSNVSFVEADFLDLAVAWPAELGTYDYVVLQGILSWVSRDLRAAAFQCVAQASKPGTLATFGYNSLPGSLNGVPFQHVVNQFANVADPDSALERAFTMFRRLRDVNAPVFEQLPQLKGYLEMLASQPAAYLAHEFITDHWTPLWHSSVAQELSGIGFGFVGTATVAEALLPDCLPPGSRAIIIEQPDDSFRQDVQDIVIRQQFRRDIFCRDPRRADPGRNLDLEAPLYLYTARPQGAPVQFKTTFGGLTVDYAVVADILDALTDGPKTAAELLALKNPLRHDTRVILLSMLDGNMLSVGTTMPGSPAIAQRFNAAVARAAARGNTYQSVAAAALGSGARLTGVGLLLLDTWFSADGSIDKAGLAQGLAQRLKSLGQQLPFRSDPISDEQLQSEMSQLANMFVDQAVPQWRKLGVME